MKDLWLAAILSGTDPVRKLPDAAFHRQLDQTVSCPKCHIVYNLIADWDHSIDRWFNDESRPLIRMLAKAVQLGHFNNHRVTHFQTRGVRVEGVFPQT